jgi:hypothetical protein
MKPGPLSHCQACRSREPGSVLFRGYVPPVNTRPVAGRGRDEQRTDELIANLEKKGFRGDFIVPLPSPHIKKNPSRG